MKVLSFSKMENALWRDAFSMGARAAKNALHLTSYLGEYAQLITVYSQLKDNAKFVKITIGSRMEGV